MTPEIVIDSKERLEQAVLAYGLLPFFRSPVPSLSVEEMAAPGFLFGDMRDDYGCWDWKGPVIQAMNNAYGKFFRRKAGFVSLSLLPDFINYRRAAYPLAPGSVEEQILHLIRRHEGLTSSELRGIIYGKRPAAAPAPRRQALEAPLQRLQMSGRLLIADFEYKYSAKGERYGWGVALYTTPEAWFGSDLQTATCSPADSYEALLAHMQRTLPAAPEDALRRLIT